MLLRSWWCAMQSEQGMVSASINTLASSHRHGCSQVDHWRREVTLGPDAVEDHPLHSFKSVGCPLRVE